MYNNIMKKIKFICDNCNKIHERFPFSGLCECGGEIVFLIGDKKTKEISKDDLGNVDIIKEYKSALKELKKFLGK